MTTETDRDEITNLLHAQARAIQAKDADATLAPYAADVVRFDLAPPLATVGADAPARAGLEGWFATWDGPIGYDLRDLSVTRSHELAYCHGFVRIRGTKTNGARADVWARQTVCLRRHDGAWRIVHQHTSVPFYMDGSLKAAVDLQP